jgi:phosphate:Na+ symporter
MTAFTSLLGGLGLFLLGMWMMTEGLKLAAGPALRSILQSWTNSRVRGLLAGILVTAAVQSSSAVTVATVGFVNAGLLDLGRAVWVVFGTNVGTTMTGWLVALVGIKVDVGFLALPMIGIGMVLRLIAGSRVRRAGLGQATAGFGVFFLGVTVLQGAFADLVPRVAQVEWKDSGWLAILGFVALGFALTVLTQSSSAAMALTLTASAGGEVPLQLAAAAVVGTNIGTTSTAFFAAIRATPPAKRVATAHIAFNLVTGIAALALFPFLLGASKSMAGVVGLGGDMPTTLALFHTLFNGLGVLLILPISARLVAFLSTLYASHEEAIGRPRHLDATLLQVPALALSGLFAELVRMGNLAFELARDRIAGASGAGDRFERRREGVKHLGQAIRGFMVKLNASPLPEDVVEALPDILRAVQHLEEVAALSADLPRAALPAVGGTTSEQWRELDRAVLASLEPDGGPEQEAALGDQLGALAARVEAAHERVKTELLRATARGELPVDKMEAALLQAQGLRRIADRALRAQRRLLRRGVRLSKSPPADARNAAGGPLADRAR